MKRILTKLLWGFAFSLLLGIGYAQAQTTVSGKVSDESGSGLPGVNIAIKGTITGTITDGSGNFKLTVNVAPPFTLVVSSIGFTTQELEITGNRSDIDVKLSEQTILGQEVVVSASRVEESVMRAPVTIEKMDILAIQQAPTADFFDAVARLKGVQSTSGSMTFNSINTRGFATIANVRFVQLVDGMDTSAPLLNFPTGNIVGLSELDIESFELVPGAGSALYGPNAFNGIMLMNGKSPFEYQGLSAQMKVGVTSSNTARGVGSIPHGNNHYMNAAIRYAKAFNNKFAFKVNFAYLGAQDWRANDYTTFRTTQADVNNPNNPTVGAPNFDGMNTYGDETPIALPLVALAPGLAGAFFGGNLALAQATLSALPTGGTNGVLNLRRTGLREQDIVDNQNARNIKADVGLYYRINDRLELSYNYRIGAGSSIYQGGERYALRDFSIQFHRLQLKGNNFFVRAYMTQTSDGDSYNMSALGGFANERFRASTSWVPAYGVIYSAAMLGAFQAPQNGGIPAGNVAAAHAFARNWADNGGGASPLAPPGAPGSVAAIPRPGTVAFNNTMAAVRGDLFKRNPPGAGFFDNSRLYHAEFNYNFTEALNKVVEFQVGGNFRRYDLFSNGTVFNEDLDGDGQNSRLTIDEFGGYAQVAKSLMDDRLKITGSIRYDKNQNFEGQFSPRASVVYSAGADKQHNFRASFQRGFRNPDTQAQFIFFPSSTGALLGGTRANAERFGIHEGGAYSIASYNAFLASGGTNPALLQRVFINYIQPEIVRVGEVGYKGIFANKLMVDASVYYNSYKNFIAGQSVVAARGRTLPETGRFYGIEDLDRPATTAPALFRPSANADVPVRSWGVGIGLNYKVTKNYILTGNYSWADYDADLSNNPEFEIGFNTPRNKFNIGLNNREVVKNVGFDISYRWQQAFRWESSFAHGDLPSFGVVDAQVSYKSKSLKSIFKLGASNLFGKDYITNAGGPFIGKMYYIGITFDEFLK
ncbi:MAG: carboxypeptidase-like regulatory domain-containing protein [Microscillaceae bacterium]|jgi:outer membrane cobalamin receptor|nr:carboxypeptidase-like regulatory domain-containing protein [Microscillaceae bacterium]